MVKYLTISTNVGKQLPYYVLQNGVLKENWLIGKDKIIQKKWKFSLGDEIGILRRTNND